jgi:hypothetical protein
MLAVTGGEAVAQEEHVELRGLGGGRDVLHQREVRPAVRRGIGMPPAYDMVPRRLHEDAEAHVAPLVHPQRRRRGLARGGFAPEGFTEYRSSSATALARETSRLEPSQNSTARPALLRTRRTASPWLP